ncbi:MAG: molybdopterin-dependent oxidoreductase, partial [Candidatus Bathyarchaeia archaeon]
MNSATLANVQTVCTLDCPCACNLTVTVENGRLIGIQPTAGFPYSPCVKGLSLHAEATHPDRLKHPLMKQGGVWKRVSWSDALDVFAARIEEAVESDGLNSILHFAQFTGSMSFMRNVPDRFFNALGGVTS